MSATGTPVATFRAFSSKFDLDGDVNGTPTDTAHIMVGETVRWQRLIGTHTVTNGVSSVDPQVGILFDVPLDGTAPIFDYTYNAPGTFPFFCRVHEGLVMNGYVVVESAVGVTPLTGGPSALGFTSEVSPNPTQRGTSFRFALREQGHARAMVLDASGRKVASLLDVSLAAGTYGASWEGRDELGRRASPGV
jgi:plastocyanin